MYQSKQTNQMTYHDYLMLDDCLSSQVPRSRPAMVEEMHFIVTHQSIELWFKLILCELNSLQSRVVKKDWIEASRIAKKLVLFSENILSQINTLSALSSKSFHEFRSHLGSASGIQSRQYREIELVCGIRDAEYIEHIKKIGDARFYEKIDKILSRPSLAQLVDQNILGEYQGDWVDFFSEDTCKYDAIFFVESLIDFDLAWSRFRWEHLMIVERIIGAMSRGTAGHKSSYLESTMRRRFFPHIWEAKSHYTEYINQQHDFKMSAKRSSAI